MWKFQLEKEILHKRFWAWRHCTGSRSVGYRVQLKGAYAHQGFRIYMETSSRGFYTPPDIHVVFNNAVEISGAEMLRRAARPEDSNELTVANQWLLIRRLREAPRIVLEEVVWAAYRMYENVDRRRAKQLLSKTRLPEEMVGEIISFI